jgi:hypothetical protein
MITNNFCKKIFKMVKIFVVFFSILIIYSCQNREAAVWISIKGDASKPNQWLCFRKTINIQDSNRLEIAQIAVDSKFWLWINDSLVVREGGLIRNANRTDTYYDNINIGSFLRKGSNTICVLVNYFGRNGGNHNSSGKSGLYFQSQHIISDKSWKVSLHPSFYTPSGEYPNFRYSIQNSGFNANYSINWTKADFDDSYWSNAIEIGEPPIKPWNNLIERPIPMFKDFGLSNYIKTERFGDTIIAHLPYSAQINPYIKVKASKNKIIKVFSDTYSLGNLRHHNSLKSEYICNDGVQEFEFYHWISGHKIIYIIPSDVEVIALKYRETGYNTEFAGNFSCDDLFLNKLWKKCQRTLYVCMRDFYMDCPDRERTQYAGDFANMMNQSFYSFDTSIYSMNRSSLERFFNWQRSDSSLYMPFGGTANEELPLQSLYLTGYHGIYQYFLYSGDTSLLRKYFPAIKKYHALWHFDNNGLIAHRKDDWYWTDWGSNIDERLLDNVLYADALKSDILIAKILGEQTTAATYQKQYNSLKDAINKNYWNGKEYRSSNFTLQPDDRGNALAVLSGIADSSKFEQITAILNTSFFASTYMERFVLDALFEMNKPNIALKRMKNRYKDMVDSQYSTIWEQWSFDNPNNTTATYNHGWSCSPLHLLPQYIAGIKPLSPNFAIYQIIPTITYLNKLESSIVTLNGNIDVKISFEVWQYLMEIYSPPLTVAKVGIPKKYYHQIMKINGSIIMNKVGRKNRKVENIKFLGEDDNYVYIELMPGKWLIEAF